MKRFVILFICISLVFMQACAHRISVVESSEVDLVKLAEDKEECREYADELDYDNRIVEGVLLGALFTGVWEFIFSDGNSDWARGAAVIGGIDGGIRAADSLEYEKSEVIKNCLHSRGYIVLN